MPFDGVAFLVDDLTRDLDILDRLWYLDRIQLDVNTASQNITPVIMLGSGDVTLSVVNTASRQTVVRAIDRLGPVRAVRLDADLTAAIKWYHVEMVIRPLDLGIQLVPARGASGTEFRSLAVHGRSPDPATALIWDLKTYHLPENVRHLNPFPRRLWIDLTTGASATVTPVLTYDSGTTASLAVTTQNGRAVVEFNLTRSERVREVKLNGDFTNAAIIVYGLGMDLYVPSARKMAIG